MGSHAGRQFLSTNRPSNWFRSLTGFSSSILTYRDVEVRETRNGLHGLQSEQWIVPNTEFPKGMASHDNSTALAILQGMVMQRGRFFE